MFLDVCERFAAQPEKVAYARKHNNAWESVTHDRLRDEVECLALGLLHLGIVPGERVGIVSENRIEWAEADFALAAIGAVDVPVFYTLTDQQIAYIFRDCEVAAVFVSNALQASKMLAVRDQIPSLRHVIAMNTDVEVTEGVVRFSDVIELGQRLFTAEERRRKFRTMAEHVQPNDLLTLIYTSGTTGHPKGVMLSHRNILSNIAAAMEVFSITESDSFLSYLPMCHSYERMSGYYLAFACGCSTYVAESIETVAENMREVHPTVMTSVPRLFERIRLRIENNIEKEGGFKRRLATWAIGVGKRVASNTGSSMDKVMVKLADALVFSKIRARMGNRLRFFISGGAALRYDDGFFFKALGITILEGYGLTETSPVLTVNREGEEQLGTVGKPLPNVEIKIASDGEILARGPNIMLGYWRDETATREVIGSDGWFHTGDIGEIDEHGYLKITDRKKHIFVSSGGKNIAPLPVESALLESRLISQLMLVGDGRDFCTALIVPERETAEDWAKQHGHTYGSWAELVNSEELHKALQADINVLQKDFSKFERARRFRTIAEPFTVENGMLTPTLKVRRKAVIERYGTLIDSMYGDVSNTD
jgi:long-chain acyl-CoA synthetase